LAQAKEDFNKKWEEPAQVSMHSLAYFTESDCPEYNIIDRKKSMPLSVWVNAHVLCLALLLRFFSSSETEFVMP